MRFEGRTALVTGGARGIGAATARRFASEGATVVVADFDEAAAQETASEIGDSGLVGSRSGQVEVVEGGRNGGFLNFMRAIVGTARGKGRRAAASVTLYTLSGRSECRREIEQPCRIPWQ